MNSALLVGLGAALLILVALLAVRNKAIFALSVRNIARRPKSAAVVITAVLISTAIISGSLVANSSLNYAVVQSTYAALGNVDEIVTLNGQPFNFSVYNTLAAEPYVANNTHGLSPTLYGPVPSVDDVTSGITSTQATLIGLNFSTDAPFGEFTLLNNTQTNASDLRSGEALINDKLAQDLNAHEGDKLTIYYGGNASSAKAYTITIKYIAQDEGKAQSGLTENIFVTLDTAQTVFQDPGQINEIRISNLGTTETGVTQSQEVTGLVAKALAGSSQQFSVQPVKEESLATAQHDGALFSNLLILLAILAVAASGALIVNVFVALGEERKSELGLARAVGMKRRHLVLLLVFEGMIAALLATTMGSVLGVGIGACIISVLNVAFNGENLAGSSLVLYYDVSDLVIAFLVGTLIAVLTVAFASLRISRLNIAGTLHKVEQSVKKSQRPIGSVLAGIALVVCGVAALATWKDAVVIDVVVPVLLIGGVALLVKQALSRRLALTLSGTLLISTAAYHAVANPANFSDVTSTIIFTAQGFLLLTGTLLVVLANDDIWLNGIAKLLKKFANSQSWLKPAVEYSLYKKSQFRMTVVIVSVVIFLIVLASVTAAVYNPDIEKQTGGYDIRVTTTKPLTNLTMLQVQSLTPSQSGNAPVALLNQSEIEYYDGLFTANVTGMTINGQEPLNSGSENGMIYGVDTNFSSHAQFGFIDTLPGLNSTQDVWNALNNPHYTVVDSNYYYGANATQVKAGDVVSVATPNGTARMVVAGVLDEVYLHGIFMSKQQMLQYFPSIKGDTLFLIKSQTGMKPIDLSYDLKKGLQNVGVNAFLIRDELLQIMKENQFLFQLTATYLGLGLIVGMASIGVITSRSAFERRQEIGIMRAIGFSRERIAKSLILEVVLAITLAMLVGLSTGLAFSGAVYLSLNQSVKAPFTIPFAQLALVFTAVYLASIVCTIIPVRNAARVSPAEAIRYVE